MSSRPSLPWRRRQSKSTATWWSVVWASRSAWAIVGGIAAFVLTEGAESLGNLRKLPGEVEQTLQQFRSWYFDDASWTGTWSSREEGDVEDYDVAEVPLKLSISTKYGAVFGEMFNRSVCELNPLLPPILVEGEIRRGRLYAHAFSYVQGKKQYLYYFEGMLSEKQPIVTLKPIKDPHGLLPPSARLQSRFQGEITSEHPDLNCPEGPLEYIRRLRAEGKLKGLDELSRTGREERKAK